MQQTVFQTLDRFMFLNAFNPLVDLHWFFEKSIRAEKKIQL